MKKLKQLLHVTENTDGTWLLAWTRPDFQGGESFEISEQDAVILLGAIDTCSILENLERKLLEIRLN